MPMIKKKIREDDVSSEVSNKFEKNRLPNFHVITGKLTTYVDLLKEKKDFKEFAVKFNPDVIDQAF